MNNPTPPLPPDLDAESEPGSLRKKINLETAVFPFRELMRYFASGHILAVAPDMDLVDIAERMAADDTEQVRQWLESGKLAKVSDEQARTWLEHDANLWTVVVRPWILVQTSPERDTGEIDAE